MKFGPVEKWKSVLTSKALGRQIHRKSFIIIMPSQKRFNYPVLIA